MKFLRLPDYLISVLFEDDDIIAVDKPYGFNSHTNDSKIEHSEFIQDGLIEIFEKQRGQKLHIIHRLDQTTTGVIIFGKSQDSAKKYAEFFFNRQVKKTYWFVTATKSKQAKFLIDQEIIHKGRELEAKTQLTLLKRSIHFELWQANPQTGRNHQIRIHAQAAAISILGDPKYGGKEFPFLCLHNHRIEFPNGIVISSNAPVYFDRLELLEDRVLSLALFEADRRLRLFPASTGQCYRLVNTTEAGFTIDHLGARLLLIWPKDSWGTTEIKRFSVFTLLMNLPMLVRTPAMQTVLFPEGQSAVPLEPTWVAKENSMQFEFKTELSSSGLNVNQRLQRSWVLKNSKDKTVLNLFASTCGYGLAAALGEAQQVTSVEANKNLLAVGKNNFSLNGLEPENYKFLCRDSLVFLNQAQNKELRYDLVVCDAPSFVRGEKGIFKIETDLDLLLTNCLKILNPHGTLLFSTSSEKLFIHDIRKALAKAHQAAGLPPLDIDCIQSAFDFGLPDDRVSLKSFLLHRN